MAKYKLEYLWLDGYEPVANLRGKTTLKEFAKFPKLEELPWWNFDGSSTRQAEGRTSDCMLKPVAVYPDTTKTERRARHVRSVICPTRRPRIRATPARRFPMIPAHGSVSSRNIFSTRTARRSASRPVAVFPRRRVNITPPSATRTSAASPAKLWTRTSSSASTPASTTKASIPKSPRASGNSRFSAKARRTPPTRCGSPAICSCASAKNTAWT